MIQLGIWASLPQAIKDEHGPRLAAYFPIPTKADPDWVDPEDGSKPDQIPIRTPVEQLDYEGVQWLKRCSAKGQTGIDAANNVITNPIE